MYKWDLRIRYDGMNISGSCRAMASYADSQSFVASLCKFCYIDYEIKMVNAAFNIIFEACTVWCICIVLHYILFFFLNKAVQVM